MKTLLLCLLFFISYHGVAQQARGSVSGRLIDSTSREGIEGVSLSVLKQSDSSLVMFVVSDAQGSFYLDGIPHGKYQLLISHINYQPVRKFFSINSTENKIDFGAVYLVNRSGLLDNVLVQSDIPPVSVKGDTTEFNAGSFKTPPNASVENLLKKLPGFNIDKTGNILFNGEKVKKVLVDGKVFFGNNPKTATRNLPADAIDKVQVFDKLTESSELSGFDDGNASKTVNLTFKKDRRKGGFGKLTMAAGTNERYHSQGNYNRFSEGKQISFIAGANNVNEEVTSAPEINGLSRNLDKLERNANYRQSEQKLTSENSIITARGAGVNYNNFTKPRLDVHADYLYYFGKPINTSQLKKQFFLPDTSWFFVQQQQGLQQTEIQAGNLSIENRFNEKESVKINTSVDHEKLKNSFQKTYRTFQPNGMITNEGYTDNHSNISGVEGEVELIYKNKMRHRGRSLFFSLSSQINRFDVAANQYSTNSFYRSGTSTTSDTIEQQIKSHSNGSNYSMRSVFTEGVFRSSLIEINAAAYKSADNYLTEANGLNRISQIYDLHNDSLSTNSTESYDYQNAGMRFRTQKYKTGFYVGALLERSELNINLRDNHNKVLSRTFVNLLPNARFKYSFTKYRNLTVTYGSFITPPRSYQLLPVADNSDPLNIRRGNPELKPEYNNNAVVSYVGSHPYKGRHLQINISYTATRNKIVTSDSTDKAGVNRSIPVNLKGAYYIFSNINLNWKLNSINGYASLGASNYFSKNPMIFNGLMNTLTSLTIGPEIKLNGNSGNLSYTLASQVNYSKVNYSVQSALRHHYINQRYEADLLLELPNKVILESEFKYVINSGLNNGFNQAMPLLNIAASKLVFRNNKGQIKFSVSDVLNANSGIIRNVTQNYIEDAVNSLLKRFISFSFTYSLSKVGLADKGR
ncbi:MAG: hypothetical protein JWN76_2820 [Chitinophagaceae bacterium]|nr:hypothetical protein [Chitinophagaceae bacterium]